MLECNGNAHRQTAFYLGFLDCILDFGISLRVGNGIADSNRVTFNQQPVVDDDLDVGVELASLLVSLLEVYNVEQRSTAGA